MPSSRSAGRLEQVADGSAYCIVPESMTLYYARPDLAWIAIHDIVLPALPMSKVAVPATYRISKRSTTNTSVSFGPMAGGNPCAP